MRIDVTPSLGAAAADALRAALEREGIGLVAGAGELYLGAWRVAALRDAVERDAEDERYAFSPRSTRGATRA